MQDGAPLPALYAASQTKPGLVRVVESGVAIEVELWQMPLERFGGFVDLVPPPLTTGPATLDSGELVKGFICEFGAVASGRDIGLRRVGLRGVVTKDLVYLQSHAVADLED